MPYYVNSANVTPDEPSPGWYYTRVDDDGEERLVGPFHSKHDALDDESDGAYSEWLESKREDNYERDLIDAGRGHLLKR